MRHTHHHIAHAEAARAVEEGVQLVGLREGDGAHSLGREHPVERPVDAKPDSAAIGHHELGAVDWKFCHPLPDVAFGFFGVVNHLASPNEALPLLVFVGHPRLKTRLVAIFRKPLELRVRERQHVGLELARFPVQANNPIVLDFEILVGVDSNQVREARCGLWLAVERVQSGAMTIGDFVLVNTYMLQIVRPLELLGFGIRWGAVDAEPDAEVALPLPQT